MGTGQEENHDWEKRTVFDSVAEYDDCNFWRHLSMEVPISRKHWIQKRAKRREAVTFIGGRLIVDFVVGILGFCTYCISDGNTTFDGGSDHGWVLRFEGGSLETFFSIMMK